MITLDRSIAVVCKMNKKGDIMPYKFRLKEACGAARTCFIEEVLSVRYSRYIGDEVITYQCTTFLDGDEFTCKLMYSIENCSWILHQMKGSVGLAI